MKNCSRCKEEKSRHEFYSAKDTKDGLRSWCKDCHKAAVRKSRKANPPKPEASRKKRLWKLYRLREDDWEAMFEAQSRACAICKRTDPILHWAVDHNHNCCDGPKSCGKCIRGILCAHCNQGLGQLQESITVLEAALNYMKEHENGT